VLLEPVLGGAVPGLGLGEDPGSATLGLDLGEPGAAAERVVS
jgi:hypothetical protein